MIDLDRFAGAFADGSYFIERIYRFVIPPKSALREFRTVKHGFLFALSGEADIRADEQPYRLRPGTIFHAGPGTHLQWQTAGSAPFEYDLLFYSTEPTTADGDIHPCSRHFILEPGVIPEMADWLDELHQQAHAGGGLAKLRVKRTLLTLLEQVLTGCSRKEAGEASVKREIEDAVRYIHSHYMEVLTLDGLAERSGMPPKRFSYYFHKYTGSRPIDYVIGYRMEKAGELLRAGKFPIRDIAASVGFANPLYFSRAFRNKFGMSPSAYSSACAAGKVPPRFSSLPPSRH